MLLLSFIWFNMLLSPQVFAYICICCLYTRSCEKKYKSIAAQNSFSLPVLNRALNFLHMLAEKQKNEINRLVCCAFEFNLPVRGIISTVTGFRRQSNPFMRNFLSHIQINSYKNQTQIIACHWFNLFNCNIFWCVHSTVLALVLS